MDDHFEKNISPIDFKAYLAQWFECHGVYMFCKFVVYINTKSVVAKLSKCLTEPNLKGILFYSNLIPN